MAQITEKQAREASEFVVDWFVSHIPERTEEARVTNYRDACALARKKAKQYGGAYLMPVIDGKKAAQWIYSDRYSRQFDA